MTLGVPSSELLTNRLDRFTRNLDGVERGEVRALHRARVASRRLREIVPVLPLRGGAADKLGRRLRRVTTGLGTVRELDVLLQIIDELRGSHPKLSRGLQRVAVFVIRARNEARKDAVDLLPMSELRRVARKLDTLAGQLRRGESKTQRRPDEAKASRWAVEARVAKRAERLQEAIADAGAVYLPERLHGVRIALKKLRYAAELLAEMSGATHAQPALRTLKRGQALLGRMHDLQILIDRTREVQASLNPPNRSVWHELDAVVGTLEDECRRLHGRFARQRAVLNATVTRMAARTIAVHRRKAG